MSGVRTAALVGATGGAGTTRTAVEIASLLARDGERVAVLDAAFGTQGLAQYAEGRIDPDITRLLLDDGSLSDATMPLELSVPGEAVAVPARAPFERLARAKAPASARAFEDLVAATADEFDRVLVDTPPLSANQAVAAVDAAERVVPVAPASTRGADALQRLVDRLADVGVEVGSALAVQGITPAADASIPGADASVPALDGATVADAPACLDEEAFAASLAEAVEVALDHSVELDFEEPGILSQVHDGL